jgi:hypothetical protein
MNNDRRWLDACGTFHDSETQVIMQVPLIPKATLQTEKVDAAAESYFRSRSEFHRVGDESDEALKYHLLFTDPATMRAAGLDYVTEDVAVYNSCYWLLVCAKRRRPKLGSTSDYEQEAFMIVEDAWRELDFAIVEEVWRLAEEDAL